MFSNCINNWSILMTIHDHKPYNGKLPRGLGKYRKRISNVQNLADGIWAYFVPGWKIAESGEHFAHIDPDEGQAISDLIELVGNAVKCNCTECIKREQKQKSHQTKRGGSRPGAGRKRINPNNKKVVKSIALTQNTIAKLEILAGKEGLSTSAYLENLIRDIHKKTI